MSSAEERWSTAASCSIVSLPSTSTERPFSSSTVRDAFTGSEVTDAEPSLDAVAVEGRAQASAAAAPRAAVAARERQSRGERAGERAGRGLWAAALMLSPLGVCHLLPRERPPAYVNGNWTNVPARARRGRRGILHA